MTFPAAADICALGFHPEDPIGDIPSAIRLLTPSDEVDRDERVSAEPRRLEWRKSTKANSSSSSFNISKDVPDNVLERGKSGESNSTADIGSSISANF